MARQGAADSPEDDMLSNAGEDIGDVPPMMSNLDIVLATSDEVRDLQVVSREFGEGAGKFEALHHSNMSQSLMSGYFESTSSRGGTTRYEGTFLNDPCQEKPTPDGQGVRVNPDGSVYAGQWRGGFPDGHGEWKAPQPSCETYVGEWKRGKKHGFGACQFANGDMYQGDWAGGLFQDRGKYIYANGDEFMGIWAKGMKVNGTFYYKDGRVSVRRWEGGRLVTSQEYDAIRRTYTPVISKTQVHDPMRNAYGTNAGIGVVSPRGIKIN